MTTDTVKCDPTFLSGMTRQHTHRWEPDEECPIFEDGAAIFAEVCRWQPTKAHTDYARDEIYSEPMGPECGEERYIRFDAAYIVEQGRTPTLYHIPDDWSDVDEVTERAWEAVESGLGEAGLTEVVEVDPDPDDGRVVVENADYRLVYAADPEAAKQAVGEQLRNGGVISGP